MIFVDLYILLQSLEISHMRLPSVLALTKVIAQELEITNQSLQSLHEDVKYDLIFTGQTVYLEHFLNDQYDMSLRRIYIEDVENDDVLYLFNKAEQNEITYLFNSAENEPPLYFINQVESTSTVDFQIFIPSDVVFEEVVLRKQFDRYRLAGPNYEIVIT